MFLIEDASAIIARQENIQQMQNYQQEVQSELQKNEKMHTEMVKKLRDLYAFKATRENPLRELRNEVLQLHTRKSEVDNAIEVLNEGIIATQIEIETVKGNLERHYQKCRVSNSRNQDPRRKRSGETLKPCAGPFYTWVFAHDPLKGVGEDPRAVIAAAGTWRVYPHYFLRVLCKTSDIKGGHAVRLVLSRT